MKNNTQKNKRETTTTRKHLKRRQRRRTVKWSAATPSVLSPRSLSLNLNFSMLVLILSDGVAVKRSLDAGACKLFTATSRQQFSQANKRRKDVQDVKCVRHRNRYRLMLQLQPSIDPIRLSCKAQSEQVRWHFACTGGKSKQLAQST